MTSLNISKVAIGCTSIEALEKRQAGRINARGTVICFTRFKPKRADELIGGSLYWIVQHTLTGRQRIVAFETVETDQGRRCHIHLDPIVVPVLATPLRAHQGWRYLAPDNAPPDLNEANTDIGTLPMPLMRELRSLGLI